MRLTFSLHLLLFFTILAKAQQGPLPLIPYPQEVKQGQGTYILKDNIRVTGNFPPTDWKGLFSYFKDELQKQFGITVMMAEKGEKADILFLNKLTPVTNKSAYQLDVSKNGIRISSNLAEPAFHAIQTFFQLLPVDPSAKKEIPFVKIFDLPRFEYRGMHLDVGRHFFPVTFIKKYIDYLAYHKLNKFHWHLTEDQGWRIEIKKYPALTKTGAWRNGTLIGRYPGKGNDNVRYGGFYTQDEIKEVIKYAGERFIEVIPEIEMPGHSSAAIAAYPWLSCFPGKPTPVPANMISQKSIEEQQQGRIKLVQETWGVFDDVFCAGNDSTFMFLENVIDEVIQLFPSKYFHVGGDECPKTNWKICPRCQQRMKELGLKDEQELQSYFIQRIEKYLNKKGKTLIGWDEILEGGLAPNAVVMSWRGEQGGIDAAKQKHKVIMTPGNPVYFDHSQSENEDSVTIGGYNSLEKVYAYQPVPKELNDEEGKFILGAQANVWTEYIDNAKKAEYMIFPRMSALSEVLWSSKPARPPEGENNTPGGIGWESFKKRLRSQFNRYDLWKANYSRAFFELQSVVLPTNDYTGILWSLSSNNTNDKIFIEPGVPGSRPVNYTKPVKITETITYETGIEPENRLNPKSVYTFRFNKATGKKITLSNSPSEKYAGDGAFTLVNGIQNEKGIARSREFLGFNGTDCEAIIDLGTFQNISSVTVHVLRSENSWIWPPQSVEALSSVDDQYYSSLGHTNSFLAANNGTGTLTINFITTPTRFVKVIVKNWGIIPEGNPGAGNKPWLFVSEIEIN